MNDQVITEKQYSPSPPHIRVLNEEKQNGRTIKI